MSKLGLLKLNIKEANLTRKTSRFRMDPYSTVKVAGHKLRSYTAKKADSRPTWNQEIQLKIVNEEDTIDIKIRDKKKLMKDPTIGETKLRLGDLCVEGLDKWFNLNYKGQTAG